ncbi:MAG TPA: hypothetical protein VF065_01830 [Ilumatobacter sp.]
MVGLGTGVSACGDDDDEQGGVDVVLSEWVVQPNPVTGRAGEITFTGDNQGGETHELVVVRAESAEGLPIDADGAVVEDELPAGALIGEIEDIESGASKDVTLDLAAGTYVLFCNVTEEEESGEIESHFAEGMHATFSVD